VGNISIGGNKRQRWRDVAPSDYSSESTPSANALVTPFCVASGQRFDFQDEAVERDMNPIDPCGSCSEWIKKIAEVNPDFKVVTFTSNACSEVFVRQSAVIGLSEF